MVQIQPVLCSLKCNNSRRRRLCGL